MHTNFSQFKDEEQTIFADAFYSLWNESEMGPKDLENSCPFGLPWLWFNGDFDFSGSIEDMAQKFMDFYKDEIVSLYVKYLSMLEEEEEEDE